MSSCVRIICVAWIVICCLAASEADLRASMLLDDAQLASDVDWDSRGAEKSPDESQVRERWLDATSPTDCPSSSSTSGFGGSVGNGLFACIQIVAGFDDPAVNAHRAWLIVGSPVSRPDEMLDPPRGLRGGVVSQI